MAIFKGVATALVTPFSKDGKRVNFSAFKKLIDMQIDNKIDALVFLGTTGEASTMSTEEKESIVKFAVKYVNKRAPVIVGAGSNNTQSAIESCIKYEQLGVDALLIVTPYYNKATQKGLIDHYSLIANSTTLPIIMYNVPSRTGVNITPKTVQKLSKIKNIVAIKEASGNLSQITEIKSLVDDDFAIYSGDDFTILPTLAIGGLGVISVVSNLLPYDTKMICDCFFNKNFEESIKFQTNLYEVIKNLFIEVNPSPIKQALNLTGSNVGPTRLPLVKMEKQNIAILKESIIKYVQKYK